MESWDDDNFELRASAVAPAISNKWEGEDEEEDVKDYPLLESWEDDDEERKEESKPEAAATEEKTQKRKPSKKR
ncbi:hypothetical protein NQ317_009322 [Molorchus minor]|uniref:Uncharacterized protein n=1 Tax=Molorchus minor TaxID=1323400 RepID=A0ABQ9JI60_9CUCU|nr:hypothetical protein NQ317_009322 [Molorchus minor]